MKKLATILFSLMIIVPMAHAKKDKKMSVKEHKKHIAMTYKKSKSKFPIKYSSSWFLSLNKRQQVVYLDTMANLMKKLSRMRLYSLNESEVNYFWNILIPYLDAQAKTNINNGTIHAPGGLMKAINDGAVYGPLFKGCPSGKRPCELYTGMAGSLSNPKVNCETSTVKCVATGNRKLVAELAEKCKGKSDDACAVVNKRLPAQTALAQGICEAGQKSGHKPTANACTAAMEAVKTAGIPASPTSTEPPSEGDCAVAFNKMVDDRDSRSDAAASASFYNNNAFWTANLDFARQACGSRSGKGTIGKIAGSCDVPESEMVSGNSKLFDSVAQKIPSTAGAPFQVCKRENIASLKLEHESDLLRIYDKKLSPRETKKQVEAATKSLNSRISKINTATECTKIKQVEGSKFVKPQSLTALLNIDGFKKRFQKDDLTDGEVNKFIAATGMNPSQYKKSFCDTKDFTSFEKTVGVLSGVAERNNPYKNLIDTTTGLGKELNAQRQSAIYMMRKCSRNLEPVTISECEREDTSNYMDLQKANERDQYLLQSKKNSNKCLLVSGYKVERMKRGIDKAGNPKYDQVQYMQFTDPSSGSAEWKEADPKDIGAKYELSYFHCNGDPERKTPNNVLFPKSSDKDDTEVNSIY